MPFEHFPNRAVPLRPSTTFLLLAGLFAVSIQFALGSEPPAVIERPAADSGPTQVSVGIWAVDISNIDSAQQIFTAELAVVFAVERFSFGSHRSGGCAVSARTDLAPARWHCE